MNRPLSIEPIVGDWYQSHGLHFEVVAVDDAERVIEIQHADGDIEEMEMDDWATRCRAGSLQTAEPPEDAHFANDREDGTDPGSATGEVEELRGVHADTLDDLDLFEQS